MVFTASEREQHFNEQQRKLDQQKSQCWKNMSSIVLHSLRIDMPSAEYPNGRSDGCIFQSGDAIHKGCTYKQSDVIEMLDDETRKYGYGGVYIDHDRSYSDQKLYLAMTPSQTEIANIQRRERNAGFCSEIFKTRARYLPNNMEISKIYMDKKCSMDDFIKTISESDPSRVFSYRATDDPEKFDFVSAKKIISETKNVTYQ